MNDLTNGNVKKNILLFSMPLILSMITQQLYNIVDTIIVGKYMGINGLAAVGNAGVIIMLIVMISGGLEIGSSVIFSKYVGEKNYKKIRDGAIGVIGFGLIIAIVFTIIFIACVDLIIAYMNVPIEIVDLCKRYLLYYFLGIVCVFGYDITRAILTTLGKSKITFLLVLFSSICNLVLDILFIGFLSLGVEGAAIATILSQGIGMVFAMVFLYLEIRKFKIKERISLQWSQIFDILKIALPSILQQAITSVSALMLQKLINPFGSEVISGYIAANKIMSLSIILLNTFSQSLSMFSAQCIAANKKELISNIYGFFARISLVYVALVWVLFLVIPKQLSNFFFDASLNLQATAFVTMYLRFSIGSIFICIFKFFHESILRGSEHMKTFLLSNISDLVIKILATFLLVQAVSLHGFWLGNTIAKVISLIISTFFIRKYHLLGGKNKKNLIDKELGISSQES